MISFLKKGQKNKDGNLSVIILLVGAAIGVALLLFGGTKEKAASAEPQNVSVHAEEGLIRYQEYLEKRITALCESMGFGKLSAIVTLEGDFEEVYATEWADGNEEFVIVGKGSSSEALPVSRKAPEIMGIGIVFHTRIPDTRLGEVISLISAAFHTPTNRIFITSASP